MDSTGEVKLWQSVILTAVNDALSAETMSKEKYRFMEARKAKDWLLDNRVDFTQVCNFANIDPEGLRKNFQKIFAERNERDERDGRDGRDESNVYKINSQQNRTGISKVHSISKDLMQSCG